MTNATMHEASRRVVLALSLFAMLLVVVATILVRLRRFDPSPDGDEGTPARLFQLTILLLVPAGAVFLATAPWERPSRVARELLVPAIALAIAFGTLFYMEWVP